MTRTRRLLFILLVVLPVVAADQATKVLAQARLPRYETFSFAGDVFRLHYAENRGAFLSLGAGLPDTARLWIFTAGTALLIMLMLVWLLRPARMGVWTTLSLTLVCAGGIGNLIDRVGRDGRVVDFLNLGIGGLRTGIFNVADIAITAGVLMLLFGGFGNRGTARRGDGDLPD
jgi:signal peptidase II